MALLETKTDAGYRFEDVAVHLGRRTVTVDGREVHLRPLVFRLLVALCAAGGGVVERAELFQLLWPDTRFPSDESLTQIVHRLRAALGPAKRCVKTLRGVGLRLDACIHTLEEEVAGGSARKGLQAVAAAPAPSVPVTPPAAPTAIATLIASAPLEAKAPSAAAAPVCREGRPLRRVALWAGIALLLATFTAWQAHERQPLIPAYGLRRGDLGAAQATTADLIRTAAQAKAAGEREQALAILVAAHRGDSTSPIPAALLHLRPEPWRLRVAHSPFHVGNQEGATLASRSANTSRPSL